MNNYTIYMHKNKINGKIYIGQTSQEPKKRWDNGRGYIDCSRFYNAILKYGWNNFEHIILYQNLSQDQANTLEEQLIKQYKTQDDRYGYNIKAGGNNKHHTEKTKIKIGKANSIALKGSTWSEHHRQIISKMFSGEGNPFYNKTHSEESRKKMSEARKGLKHLTEEQIKRLRESHHTVKVINVDTGEVFDSIKDAGLKYNIEPTHITRVCKGKRKTCGGYRWEYVKNL